MNIKYIDPFKNSNTLFEHANGLTDDRGNIVYPFISGAYRCTPEKNYADSFGFQWNIFQKTQIDGNTESDQSTKRFCAATNWNNLNLEGENILEVGSGAGRFTQVVLAQTKANLYSVDYSTAVEANYKNNGHSNKLKLFQASIYELPFANSQFDRVFCFGVLQHTPDFKKSIQALTSMLKPGGEIAIDFYPIKGWYTKINAKYLFRPFTKKIRKENLLRIIQFNAGWLIFLSKLFTTIKVGKLFNRFLPICDIETTMPPTLTPKQLKEWVILDTFDMFSPEYDNPQKISTVKIWLEESGVKVVFADFIQYDSNSTAAVIKGIKN
jgi:SAM-dependent methyltransferase